MKRDWWRSGGMALFGAPFIGVGVFQICAGHSFAKGHTVAHSDHPYEYWINIGFWFALGLLFVVQAIKIYLRDDEDSEDGQDK